MYKNIIFDIGNVLLNFYPKEHLKTRISDPVKVEEVYSLIYESEEWLMLDRGTITELEAIQVFSERSRDNEDHIRLAFDNWYGIFSPIEETVNILKSLKAAGYKVLYLSNFHHLAFENILERFEFFSIFDGGVVSYKEKLLKPEARIYERIIEEFSLEPSETIFIDDTRVNVEGAVKAGITGIQFTGPENLRLSLEELKVKI